MSQKIWVLGDAVVDLIPDGENHYLRCAGGAPANVAVGISRSRGQRSLGRIYATNPATRKGANQPHDS